MNTALRTSRRPPLPGPLLLGGGEGACALGAFQRFKAANGRSGKSLPEERELTSAAPAGFSIRATPRRSHCAGPRRARRFCCAPGMAPPLHAAQFVQPSDTTPRLAAASDEGGKGHAPISAFPRALRVELFAAEPRLATRSVSPSMKRPLLRGRDFPPARRRHGYPRSHVLAGCGTGQQIGRGTNRLH